MKYHNNTTLHYTTPHYTIHTHFSLSTGTKIKIRLKISKNNIKGGTASSAFTQQNTFYTGTNSTMIPFSPDVASAAAVSMGVSNVHSAIRSPPTLWQYPGKIWLYFILVGSIYLNLLLGKQEVEFKRVSVDC